MTKWKIPIVSLSLIGVLNDCGASDAPSTTIASVQAEKQTMQLPVVEVAIGWSTTQARAKSPILARLPEGFDTWQSAYLNTPAEFVYRDDVIGFSVERPHAFSVYPHDGKVVGVTVELDPLFEEDFDGALSLAQQWCAIFESKHLSTPDKNGLDIDTTPATKSAIRAFQRLPYEGGISIGTWQRGDIIYAVDIERFTRTVVDRNTNIGTKKLVYKVEVSISDRSTYKPIE